jgi:hypothetical protein
MFVDANEVGENIAWCPACTECGAGFKSRVVKLSQAAQQTAALPQHHDGDRFSHDILLAAPSPKLPLYASSGFSLHGAPISGNAYSILDPMLGAAEYLEPI